MIGNGKVLYLKKFKGIEFLRKNRVLLLMSLLFIIGIIISVTVYSEGTKISALLTKIFNYYISKRSGAKFAKVFLTSILGYLSVIALYFIFGTSMMGLAIIPIFTLTLGFLSGGISSVLYSQYALKGVAFNALIVIPPALVFLISLFFCAKESLCLSLSISKLTLYKGSASSLYEDFKKFCGKYLLMIFFLIAAALLDSTLSRLFIKFFDF